MPVKSALQIINEEIDLFFNDQVGDMDAASRFCIDLYIQNAFNDIRFGDADILARARVHPWHHGKSWLCICQVWSGSFG